MASPVEFFQRRKREIDRIVDQTFFRLLEGTDGILRYIPRTNYVNRKLLAARFSGSRPTMASIVAEEQEIPASRPRMQLDEDLMSNCKVGKQIIWKAKDFELMHEMQLLLAGGGQAAAAAIEKHYFGTVADLVPACYDKALFLAMKVATTGSCVYTDPLSGARIEYTVPGTISALLPAALTTGARWSQPTTCTPLANLEAHARSCYDQFGIFPQAVAMHWDNLRQIADSNEAKIAKLRTAGADSTTPDVTGMYLEDDEVIAMVRQRTRAQEVFLFDAQYSEELANGTENEDFFLPENYYTFLWQGNLEQAFVPTVERSFQPGIYTNTRQINDAPRVERSVAVANCVIAAWDGRKIAARRVA